MTTDLTPLNPARRFANLSLKTINQDDEGENEIPVNQDEEGENEIPAVQLELESESERKEKDERGAERNNGSASLLQQMEHEVEDSNYSEAVVEKYVARREQELAARVKFLKWIKWAAKRVASTGAKWCHRDQKRPDYGRRRSGHRRRAGTCGSGYIYGKKWWAIEMCFE